MKRTLKRSAPLAMMVVMLLASLSSGCSGDEEASQESAEATTSNGTSANESGGDTSAGTESNTSADESNTSADESNSGTPGCEYPENNGIISTGKVMPRLWWDEVVYPDGTVGAFDLEAFHCSPEYAEHTVAIFVVTAGWCPACPAYITHVGERLEALEAAGALVLFVETETSDGSPATSEAADAHVTAIIGENKGFRVGDGQTNPEPMAIHTAPLITSFPGGFVVRRSDMVIIGDEGQSNYYLPLEELAANPGEPAADPGEDREPSCSPTEEEIYEPNNVPSEATLLEFGDYTGGICDGTPDFYTINERGRWLFEIRFSQKDGDLDFYLWDPDTNRAVVDREGNPIGSDSSDDNEVFQWEGPATIKIFGYNGSTAIYDLSLVDL